MNLRRSATAREVSLGVFIVISVAKEWFILSTKPASAVHVFFSITAVHGY